MNKINYTKLKKGQGLDELVCEQVFGWMKRYIEELSEDINNQIFVWVSVDNKQVISVEQMVDKGITPKFSSTDKLLQDYLILVPNIYKDYVECLIKIVFPSYQKSKDSIAEYTTKLLRATPYECCIAALQASKKMKND